MGLIVASNGGVMLRRRSAALAALVAAGIVACGLADRVHAIDQTAGFSAKPSLMPGLAALPWSYGVMLGANLAASAEVNSTSGFYRGGYEDFAGIYGGVFANIPFAATGPRAVPFQSWIWSVSPMLDFMRSSRMSYNGLGGGAPVTGSGTLSQLDVLLLLKATTPVGPADTLSFFGGVGAAALRPRGNPTGPGGPALTGSALTPAFRAGVEWSHRMNGSYAVALQAFYQHTGSATFDTTLPGERFDFRGNDSFMLGLSFTVGDTPPAGPGPGGPAIRQDAKPATMEKTDFKPIRLRTVLDGGVCIKGGNCGAFIWRAEDGGFVSDHQRISIYKSGKYVKATTPKPCDVVFYNSEDNDANTHVEFVVDVDENGKVTKTIGQDGDKKPITTGPMKDYGQVMTPNPPPAGAPSDAEIAAARKNVKDPSKLKDWEEFLKLCRAKNKIDLSGFPKERP